MPCKILLKINFHWRASEFCFKLLKHQTLKLGQNLFNRAPKSVVIIGNFNCFDFLFLQDKPYVNGLIYDLKSIDIFS